MFRQLRSQGATTGLVRLSALDDSSLIGDSNVRVSCSILHRSLRAVDQSCCVAGVVGGMHKCDFPTI